MRIKMIITILAMMFLVGGFSLVPSTAQAHCGTCGHGPTAKVCKKCKKAGKKTCACHKKAKKDKKVCDHCRKAGKKTCGCGH